MSMQLTLAFRYLWGRRLRTVLTTLAVVLGVMIIFGLNGVIPAIEDSFRQNLVANTSEANLVVTGETRGVLDAGLVDVVRAVPGVDSALGALVRPVVLPAESAPVARNGQPIVSYILTGLDPSAVALLRPFNILEGRSLAAADDQAVLIPATLASDTGLAPGDTLRLPAADGSMDLQIVGVVNAPPSAGAVELWVPLTTAQDLLGLSRKVNTIEAQLAPGSDPKAVGHQVLAALGPGFKLGGNEIGTELLATSRMISPMLTLFGVLALVMGGFIIFNTFRTAIVERRRDIGMLRALGATRRTVLGIVLAESLLQGVVGTALGLLAGFALVTLLLAAVSGFWEDFMRFPLGKASFSPQVYLLSIGLGVGVTVLAGLQPAVSAGRVPPLEAMRPTPQVPGKRPYLRRAVAGAVLAGLSLLALVSGNLGLMTLGVMLFFLGLVLLGPALVEPIARTFGRLLDLAFAREGSIARGNLVRQPGRAAVTVSAMMIGLAVVLALAGMAASLVSAMWEYMDRSLGADYLLMPQAMALGSGNVGAGPELARAVGETPGVAEVTTLRISTARAGGADLQVIGIDPATFPDLSGLVFSQGEPEEAYGVLAGERALILNGIAAAQVRVALGDSITLSTPRGPQTYRVVGVGLDFLNVKMSTAYLSQENLARDFSETSDVMLMADRSEGADAGAVKAALQTAVAGYPALTLHDSDVWRQGFRGQLQAMVWVLYVLVGLLAVPSLLALVNTLGINVLERTREIGVMRAVGATRRQVRRTILAESLLLTAAGTAFGILAGLWLGYILVGALNVGGFVVPYRFPYAGILVTVAVGLLFGVIGALIPARHAARLNVVSALAYE
ncbi:MAG TPA: FtsX-like permease family protein [Anaerolineae bacterium]|nr:FtsX-like permease family protein [Anaerolineae bacterium]